MPLSNAELTPRETLLQALVDHFAERGIGDASLRAMAAAVGSSHRMLSYHFGSRAGVLVAVAQHVEAEQRAALAALEAAPASDPLSTMQLMWERLVDPALWPSERLFFELYARALQGDPETRPFLDGVIEPWLGPSTQLFTRLGFSPAEAAAEARLSLAVSRGLLLDLLATGDREAVDAAIGRYLARYADRQGRS